MSKPGSFQCVISKKAKTALAIYRIVMYSAADEVKYPTAATDVPYGITAQAQATAGERVDIVVLGFTWVTAAGAITEGGHFQINSTAGKAKALVATGYDCGIVLETSASDGDQVPCLFNPIGIPKA